MSHSTDYVVFFNIVQKGGVGGQTHVNKNTDFVMAFWHKINIILAYSLLNWFTKRLSKGRIV